MALTARVYRSPSSKSMIRQKRYLLARGGSSGESFQRVLRKALPRGGIQLMFQRLFGSWGLLLLVALSGGTRQSQSPVLGSGQGIDHVGVAVRDLNATVEIYRNRLGFT